MFFVNWFLFFENRRFILLHLYVFSFGKLLLMNIWIKLTQRRLNEKKRTQIKCGGRKCKNWAILYFKCAFCFDGKPLSEMKERMWEKIRTSAVVFNVTRVMRFVPMCGVSTVLSCWTGGVVSQSVFVLCWITTRKKNCFARIEWIGN